MFDRQEKWEMENLIGSTIGGCRLEALLSASGSGELYRARHVRNGQTLAVRLLAVLMEYAPDLRAAFGQEMRLAALLDHPHIVRVLDSGEWQGRGYLVSEYLPASSLADLVATMARNGRPIGVGLALDLAQQAADGLAYAHHHGVIHGEIRPTNLLVQRDPARAGRVWLKVADFGLARLGGEMLAVGNLSVTPLYLAPELCRGEAPDPRSDIYGLGLALYEALAGRPAFPAASYAEAVRRQLAGAPPPLRKTRPDLPAEVEALVLGCLANTPADRPQSAATLSATLGRMLRPAAAAA